MIWHRMKATHRDEVLGPARLAMEVTLQKHVLNLMAHTMEEALHCVWRKTWWQESRVVGQVTKPRTLLFWKFFQDRRQ